MDNQWDFAANLIIWMGAVGLIVGFGWRKAQNGVGLIFTYLITMAMIHWLASLFYLQPTYSYYPPEWIEAGLQESLYGVLGLATGAIGIWITRRRTIVAHDSAEIHLPHSRLPQIYIFIGLISYFVIFPISNIVPSLTALTSSLNQLLLSGIALACWQAWHSKNRILFTRWLIVSLVGLPLLTLVSQGFIGYGVVNSIIIIMFLVSFIPAQRRVMMLLCLMTYIMLSVYVTYMRDRNIIRASVWGGQAYSQRLQVTYETFTNFEWFDPTNMDHLRRIDERLNQNFLVGASVYYLRASNVSFANGETIGQAALALIPRILWPGKPLYAGSPGIVTRYTGIGFAYGTSVGIGQVMEFYINFGSAGVFLGFLVLGVVFAVIDEKSALHLRRGEWDKFICWYLPGLSLLQIGGSLVEIMASLGGAIVAAFVITRGVLPLLQNQPQSGGEKYIPIYNSRKRSLSVLASRNSKYLKRI